MEARLFEKGTTPEWTTPDWYVRLDRADHLSEPIHHGRLTLAARMACDVPADTLVDLGAGDGGLLSLVAGSFGKVWGYDLIHANVRAARKRGVDVRLVDVLTGEIDWAQVAVCTETLEHLIDPHAFVAMIRKHSDWLVCSSPYTETPDAHYPHHAWCWDQEGYAQMLTDAGWSVVAHETVDIFQVVLSR